MNKKILASAVVLGVAVGSFGVANAASSKPTAKFATPTTTSAQPTVAGENHVDGFKTVLDGLVTAKTITQAQEDAILAAFAAARPAGGPDSDGPNGHMGGKGGPGFAAEQNTILTTLGITAADLDAARVAGKSLATLAGAKTTALINALVALENSEIDAHVTAGTMTAAQATTAKANVVAQVTAQVNGVPGMGMGMGRHGH